MANQTWTPLLGTGLEVYQESGGTVGATVHEGHVTLHLGAVWSVRSACAPTVPHDDRNYQLGQEAARTVIDIGAHTHNTILALLSKAETTQVTAHYNRQSERYAKAKGMADAIREYLEALS